MSTFNNLAKITDCSCIDLIFLFLKTCITIICKSDFIIRSFEHSFVWFYSLPMHAFVSCILFIAENKLCFKNAEVPGN